MEKKSDDELYQRFRSGDTGAFDELIRRYDEALLRYLYGLLHDHHDAEDLMEEAFARLLVKRPLIGKGCFKAYLFETGRHLAFRFLKYRKREIAFCPEEESVWEDHSKTDTPERLSLESERKAALYRCLSRIELSLREALCLVYVEGLSYREAADIMRVNEKRVNHLLDRGKKQMRIELEKEGVTGVVL